MDQEWRLLVKCTAPPCLLVISWNERRWEGWEPAANLLLEVSAWNIPGKKGTEGREESGWETKRWWKTPRTCSTVLPWATSVQIFNLNTHSSTWETHLAFQSHHKIKVWAESEGSLEMLWRAADGCIRRSLLDSWFCYPCGVFRPILTSQAIRKETEGTCPRSQRLSGGGWSGLAVKVLLTKVLGLIHQ